MASPVSTKRRCRLEVQAHTVKMDSGVVKPESLNMILKCFHFVLSGLNNTPSASESSLWS